MRVLIAEDDRTSRWLLEATLQRLGHETVVTCDGSEAWQALQAEDVPQLAILDWMMPGVDGVELCRRVRRSARLRHMYLLLLTAKSTREDLVEGLEAGADDYVRKPFDRDELHARLRVGERVLRLQASLAERVTELQDALRRVSERTAAQQASEARLRAIVDSAQDGIVTLDVDGVIGDCNPAAEKMFGWPRGEATGRALSAMITPKHREAYGRRLDRQRGDPEAPGADGTLALRALRRGGDEFPIELSLAGFRTAEGRRLSAIIRDVTHRNRLEVELRHAQKLEAVGQLAAGIAHEINTPIQFVGDNTRFIAAAFTSLRTVLERYRALREAAAGGAVAASLLEGLREAEEAADLADLEEEIPKAIGQTLDGVGRVATIVRAMKEFAHPDTGQEKAAADLNRALLSTLTVARNELKYVADVHTDLGELPPVLCHVGDLNQVFLNLLVNAAHAVADVVRDTGEKGHIRVRTAREGDSVVIAISDSGCGIPEEIRTKIFDPFFTTKDVGRGTGQGLAIARAVVVEKHGGTITAESAVGRGTTFFVRLPIAEPPAARETTTA